MWKYIVRTVHERARVPWTHRSVCLRSQVETVFPPLGQSSRCDFISCGRSSGVMSPSAQPRVNNCTPLHTHTLYLDPLLKPIFSTCCPPFQTQSLLSPSQILRKQKHSTPTKSWTNIHPFLSSCFVFSTSRPVCLCEVLLCFFFQTLLSNHLSGLLVPKKSQQVQKVNGFFSYG